MKKEGTENHSIVLFDGVCGLCDASVKFIIDHDPCEQFRFAPLQSAVGQELLKERGLPTDSMETMVLIEGGRHFERSAAALRIARRLSFPWNMLAGFWLVPRPIRDAAYGAVAKRRLSWFGTLESCAIPTPELRQRFLG